MRSLRIEFKQARALVGALAIGLWSSGCSHLTYTDPNPPQPFAFPGQGVNNTAAAPANSTPPPPTFPPLYPPTAPPQVNQQLAPVGFPVGPTMSPPPSTPVVPGRGTSLLTVGETVTISWSDLPGTGWLPTITRIGEDGRIILPYNVSVVAAGKTANQLAQDIRNEYVPRLYRQLTATVKTEERFYYVGGEVKIPARQPYLGQMTVLRAIDTAGGFTDFAARNRIELRRQNGQTQMIDWKKAIKDPRLDPPVFPSDQITVHKRGIFGG